MNKNFLIIFLGLGLITLSACTSSSTQVPAENDAVVNEASQEVEENNFIDGSYEIDTQSSTLSWHGARIVASDHTGLIDIKSGNLEILDNELVGGEFVIDMTTISSDEDLDRLVDHLKSDDFFSVDTYPEARLIINEVIAIEDTYMIEADLSIKDVTDLVVFYADLSQDGDTILASADFVIDRTRWGIRYDSGNFFQNLGDRAIKDDITFGVNLVANLQ